MVMMLVKLARSEDGCQLVMFVVGLLVCHVLVLYLVYLGSLVYLSSCHVVSVDLCKGATHVSLQLAFYLSMSLCL